MRLQFGAWSKKFKRQYITKEEKEARFNVWMRKHLEITWHNSQEESWKMGHNKWSDLTSTEWLDLMGMRPLPIREMRLSMRGGVDEVPQGPCPTPVGDGVDWRNPRLNPKKVIGVLPQIKNQEQCGGCWAFATVSSVESYQAIFAGKMQSLSEQQLIDCDTKWDMGCNGGLPYMAFPYVISQGLMTEADYPYLGENAWCEVVESKIAYAGVKDYGTINGADEDETEVPASQMLSDMTYHVEQHPVTIGIQGTTLQSYSTGIITTCTGNLNHAVVVVGYEVNDSNQSYWIVRNSWGPSWGMSGYCRVLRDTNNICMILSFPAYPCPPNGPEPCFKLPNPPS